MIVTTIPQQLTLLPLGESVQKALAELLTEPFGSLGVTEAFWSEQGCKLFCLLSEDSASVVLTDPDVSRLLDYPESTDLLPDDWRLILCQNRGRWP